jgi:hypothetical protein
VGRRQLLRLEGLLDGDAGGRQVSLLDGGPVGRQVGRLGELRLLGQQSLLPRVDAALRERGQRRSTGTGPHLNGPGPRIVGGGPGRAGPSRRPRCGGGNRGSVGAWSRVAASPTVLLLVLRLGGATTGPRRATAGRCRLARGASGDKSSGGGNRVLHHVDLLEELVADDDEGGEWAPAPEMDADVLVALVEPTKHVEDQGAVSDVLVEVSEVC